MPEMPNEPLNHLQSISQQTPSKTIAPRSEDNQQPQSEGDGSDFPQGGDPAPASVFDADWQCNSILLFADQVCTWLNAGKPKQTSTEAILCELIGHFIGAMELYYDTGINVFQDLPPDNRPSTSNRVGLVSNNDPLAYERRRMVQIIGDEWDNLMSLVVSARFLTQQTPVINAIEKAVDQALGDLNLTTMLKNRGQSPDRSAPSFAVLPQFGRNFELVSFRYAPQVFVLGVPVTSLYCPWNWTVIWHEMAGIYIQSERHLRQRESDQGVVAAVYKSLDKLNSRKGRRALRDNYSNWLNRNRIISNDRLSFDDAIRWNWAEELVEDAIGVLCMGRAMVDVISSVLKTSYAPSQRRGLDEGPIADLADRDRRHPPPDLRIAVARRLADLLKKESTTNEVMRESTTNEVMYADTIAQAIFDRRHDLVNRLWSPEEDALYEESIDIDPSSLVQKLGELAGQRVHYALIASAVHRGKLNGDAAQLIFFKQKTQRQASTQVDPKSLGLDELTKDLILEQAFSERDQFMVSFDHMEHTDSRTVGVSFSRTYHSKYHTGYLNWTHSH